MKDFCFKEEWGEHNKTIGIILLGADLLVLLIFNYIKENSEGRGRNLDITSIIFIMFITLFFLVLIVTLIYIFYFTFKAKTMDTFVMFPEIEQCFVFSNVDNLSISSKEDILNWYNIVEYEEISKIEAELDPKIILGEEHVWLVTSDLTLELKDDTLISTIKDNIRKGIRYTYFLPDEKKFHLEIERLNNIYGKGNINIVLLNKQCKLLFQLFDVIIFNPINDFSKTFICVDFSNPRKYRKIAEDDAEKLITNLNNVVKHKEIT